MSTFLEVSTFLEAPADSAPNSPVTNAHSTFMEAPAEPRVDLDEEPKDTPMVLQQVYFVCDATCQLQHLICHDMHCRNDCLQENGLHYL